MRDKSFNLPRALADAERAMLLSPDSADAAFVAMWLYSYSAQKNPADVSRALALLEKALLLGLEPEHFAIDVDPKLATVRADKRYASVRGVVSPVPYSRTIRTVDPTRGPGALGTK